MPVQNKPIIHARDHLTDGADPIRGLLPTSTGSYMERVLAEPSLIAYWPLSDASAPALDVSPNDYHLAEELEAPEYHLEGPLPTSIYPYAVGFDGTHAVSGTVESLAYQAPSSGEVPFDFTTEEPFTLEIYAYAETDPGGTAVSLSMISLGEVPTILDVTVVKSTGEVRFLGVNTTGITLNQATWVHVAATYDGAGAAKIYFDGALVGSGEGFDWGLSLANRVEVGGHDATPRPANWTGRLAHAAVYNEALTASQIASHVSGGSGTIPPGWVPTPDPDNPGEIIWAPPGTEIEHGDGTPDENPVTTPGGAYLGTPENAAGWHLQAHHEYVVLYDSSPARFDVPPRQWIRVPFNTVRIYRRWELTVDGSLREAWLPDDRGLTEHATNGTLLITPEMTFGDQTIAGWFTIEYPVLNYLGLPDYTGGIVVAPDRYTRAARMISVTSGQVLRWQVEPTMRAFFEWPFYDDADGDALASYWTVDNPFPIYPHWPARPLNKPLPYPKLTNAASLDYYAYNVSNLPGFELGSLEVEASLPAGHAIALQAWQDTPYTLRFGTDKYPPYTPYNYVEQFRKRPCLVISHYYDPDTVDHTTGALL